MEKGQEKKNPGVAVHAYQSGTWKSEAKRSRVQGQTGEHTKTLTQNHRTQQKVKNKKLHGHGGK